MRQLVFSKRYGIGAALFVIVLLAQFTSLGETLVPETLPVEETQNTTDQNDVAVAGTFSEEQALQMPEAAAAGQQTSLSGLGGRDGTVVRVVDGDTIEVMVKGVRETARVIGMNTPETVHPSRPVECFGREASARAKELLSGKTVTLVTDTSQGERDAYRRLLAEVILEDGRDFAEEMIQSGYAYEYTYRTPYAKQSRYKAAQKLAAEEERGLWAPGVCETAPTVGTAPAAVVVSEANGCTIKGNINSSGEKIYHVPGQRYYAKTVIDESKGERWFCSAGEAVAAGWRASKQ